MNQKGGWFKGVKQKFEGVFRGDIIPTTNHGCHASHEKLPPRLQLRGISVAARVVGNEIRQFTKRTTGKDLASLRESKTRNQVLSKLSEFRVAITNKDTKYNLLTLACNHSSNFITSLSPEGSECSDIGAYFIKNTLHEFIARYHKQCIDNETVDAKVPHFKQLRAVKRKAATEELQSENILDIPCPCNSNYIQEKRGKYNFLSCWEHKGISEEKLNRFYLDNVPHFKVADNWSTLNIEDKSGWMEFIKNDKVTVFRKKLKNDLYEYRVQASFNDISANHLFKTQIDGEYRKKWDGYVLDLSVIDSHKKSSSELIHWVTKCPYPFSTREYIYLRRQKVDRKNKALILYSEATNDIDIPKENKIQRVDTYVSKLIIKPHTDDFDENGCDFLLTYYDDPKMMLLPAKVLDIAASKGISDSMTRMHQAALSLAELNLEKED